MLKRYLLGLGLLLGACAQVPFAVTPDQVAQPVIVETKGVKYFKHQFTLGYRDDASLQAAAKTLGASVIDVIPEIKVALLETNGDAWNVVRQATGLAGIRSAEVNSVMAVDPKTTIEKPFETESLLPQTNNPDQIFDVYPQYALDPRHLNAKVAWDLGFTGKGVIIADVDDPTDITHPDIAPSWNGKAYDPVANKVYTDGKAWAAFASAAKDTTDPARRASNSHGTFTGGTMTSAKDGKGIVGLAYESKIMPVSIFNPGFVGGFAVARGIVWAVNNGAKVQNHSWGGGGADLNLKQAFDYALANGVVMVASSGNSYLDQLQLPATYPGVMVSGAAKPGKERHTFSNYGRYVSTVAPGYDVVLTAPSWENSYSGKSLYALISGTSFSAPYTSATAALVFGKCPTATPYQVQRIIEQTADSSVGSNKNGWDRETGYGHVDAGKLAQTLTSCDKLPAKGATVRVDVQLLNDGNGLQPASLGNVTLRSKSVRPGDPTDASPIYQSITDLEGKAWFVEIAPGDYDVFVGGVDISLTGGTEAERGGYVGSITAISGSSYGSPNAKPVVIDAKAPNFNPTDPYEPNDTTDDAKAIKYGDTTELAYIFGKDEDVDFFKFEGKKDDEVQLNMDARTVLGGRLDAYLFLVRVVDGKLAVVAEDDDTNGTDAQIIKKLPADDTYYVIATSFNISVGTADNNPFNKYRLRLKKL
jgi:subtilisin family serine protease